MNRSKLRQGFSLLEVIVVVAILSIIAGAAVPVALKGLTSKARKVTQEELRDLSGAVVEYFRDTLALPADLADLEVAPVPAVTGWTGPYLPGAVADTLSGTSGYQVDAWSRAYDFDITGDLVTITSLGQDALLASADDLAIQVSVTFIRRENTIQRLKEINAAVLSYNNANMMSPALPANWTTILNRLVTENYLPSATPYQTDAWGDDFVEDPSGMAPVVRVGSSNL